MELIRVNNIKKSYRVGDMDIPVLKGISFSVNRGELLAIVGASGSGKSTLMNILGCLDRPTSGEYWLDGKEVSKLDRDERALVRTDKLGFVFQNFNLLTRTNAVNNVLMPLDYSPVQPPLIQANSRAIELLTRVGLQDHLAHVPSKMSGGQQQRLAIARSLINQPILLLADEPTGNLDSKTSIEILRMFQQLNTEGITIILVTHDPSVMACAHRTIRLEDGMVVEDVSDGPKTILYSLAATLPPEESQATVHGERLKTIGSGEVETALPSTRKRETVHSKASVEISSAVGSPRHLLTTRYFPPTLRTAVSSIWQNKMRSVLTTLGVIIGVAAVIAMVEISQGSQTSLMNTMSTMGANTIVVRSGAASSGGISMGSGSEKTLTPDDAEGIAKDCPAVAFAAPIVQVQGQVVRGNRNWVPMQIYGTIPDYLDVRDWTQLHEGEMFTSRDVRGGNKVCVIGETLVKAMFEGESPVGKDIRIKNVSFRVVGVLSRKGANMMGMDQDDIILAPWTTIKYRVSGKNSGSASSDTTSSTSSNATSSEVNTLSNLYPQAMPLYPKQSASQAADTPQPVRFINVDTIMVKARSSEMVEPAINQITSLLRERHRIHYGKEDDFNIRNMAEMMKAMGSMAAVMGGLLLIVALISLVVGGVGIMNIMLVSVTERTREIGIRMAVGARSSQILQQFLIEAIVLCTLGGIMGILIGRGASLVVWMTLHWPVQMSLLAVAGAFLIAAAVGIAFGFYPAWKASRLDPIEALRYE